MSEEIKRKILTWASIQLTYQSRKEFNDGVKEVLGEEGYRIAQELWKERFITLGRMGSVTISRKGILELGKQYDK